MSRKIEFSGGFRDYYEKKKVIKKRNLKERGSRNRDLYLGVGDEEI